MNTHDKLFSWGLIQANSCALCDRFAEDHDHIFFHCIYSSMMWANVLKQIKCKVRTTGWQSIIDWLNSTTGWTIKFPERHRLICILIYSISPMERKEQQTILTQCKSQKIVLKDIIQSIAYNVGTWRKYKCSKFNWELAINLGVSTETLTRTNPLSQLSQPCTSTTPSLHCDYRRLISPL